MSFNEKLNFKIVKMIFCDNINFVIYLFFILPVLFKTEEPKICKVFYDIYRSNIIRAFICIQNSNMD